MFERMLGKYLGEPPQRPVAESVDYFLERRRQYVRAREYCGFSLDDIINSRAAAQYMREIWLVGCMIRKPEKAATLPPGQLRHLGVNDVIR
jgi:hypothetical protein